MPKKWSKTPDDPKNTAGRTGDEYNAKREAIRSDQGTNRVKGAIKGAIIGGAFGGPAGMINGAIVGSGAGGFDDQMKLNKQKHDAQKYGVIPGESMMGPIEKAGKTIRGNHDAKIDAKSAAQVKRSSGGNDPGVGNNLVSNFDSGSKDGSGKLRPDSVADRIGRSNGDDGAYQRMQKRRERDGVGRANDADLRDLPRNSDTGARDTRAGQAGGSGAGKLRDYFPDSMAGGAAAGHQDKADKARSRGDNAAADKHEQAAKDAVGRMNSRRQRDGLPSVSGSDAMSNFVSGASNLHNMMQSQPSNSSGGIGKQFDRANQRFEQQHAPQAQSEDGMQSSNRGWANPKVQAAAKAAQGKKYNGPTE